ncbi:MAG: tetratricopeptide repeat protein [Nitrospinae bacterium]|nr:tetratricopeptide repeat protein [Nitrospinota bacterium]
MGKKRKREPSSRTGRDACPTKDISQPQEKGFDPTLFYYPLIIIILTIIVYANSIQNQFTHDDVVIIQRNELIQDIRNIGKIFLSDYWVVDKDAGLYRPLVVFSYAINYLFNEFDPAGFHLVNLFIHILNSLLVFLILYYLFKPACALHADRETLYAFVSSLIFAIHPIHTEAVSGIVGRAELMAVFFFAIAWIVYILFIYKNKNKSLRGGRMPALLLSVSLFSFFLTLLSKENGITFLLIPLLTDIVLESHMDIKAYLSMFIKNLMTRYIYFLIPLISYFGLRYIVLGSIIGIRKISFIENVTATADIFPRILTAFTLFLKYITLLLFPIKLTLDYSFNQIPLKGTLYDLEVLFSIFIAIIFIWGLIYSFRKKDVKVFLGLAFFFITYSVISNLIIPIGTIFGERLIYTPSFGFSILIAYPFFTIWRSSPTTGKDACPTTIPLTTRIRLCIKGNPIGLPLLISLILFYSIRTISRNNDWKDNYHLFLSASKVSPESLKVRSNMGVFYGQRGLYDEQLIEFKKAEAIYPDDKVVNKNLYAGFMQMGVVEEGIAFFEGIISATPEAVYPRFYLAKIYADNMEFEKSIQQLERFLELVPDHEEAKRLLEINRGKMEFIAKNPQITSSLKTDLSWRRDYLKGKRLMMDKDISGALKYFEEALKKDPIDLEFFNDLGYLYLNLGKLDKAEDIFKRGVTRFPQNVIIRNNLASIYFKKGRYHEAEEEWKTCLRLDPTFQNASKNLAILKGMEIR